MEQHSIAHLIGTTPGFVDNEERGQIIEAVRRKPYSLVLFDEIDVEKGHQSEFSILLQVLDNKRLANGRSRTVDFTNKIIVMTSNWGADHLITELVGKTTLQASSGKVMLDLKMHYRPGSLNYLDEILVFDPLSHDHLRKVSRLQMKDCTRHLIEFRIAGNTTIGKECHGITIAESFVAAIEVAWVDAKFTTFMLVHSCLDMSIIGKCGSEEQRHKYLLYMIDTKTVMCWSWFEFDYGNDASGLRTIAMEVEGSTSFAYYMVFGNSSVDSLNWEIDDVKEFLKEVILLYSYVAFKGVEPLFFSFGALFKSWRSTLDVNLGAQLNGQGISAGKNALIGMYKDRLFCGMTLKTMVVLTVMVNGYAQYASQKEVMRFFQKMKISGIEVTMDGAISAAAQLGATKCINLICENSVYVVRMLIHGVYGSCLFLFGEVRNKVGVRSLTSIWGAEYLLDGLLEKTTMSGDEPSINKLIDTIGCFTLEDEGQSSRNMRKRQFAVFFLHRDHLKLQYLTEL